MAECFYCIEAGRAGSVALRTIRGKGVCNAHLPDMSFPAVMHQPVPAVIPNGSEKSRSEIQGGKMPGRASIDTEQLRKFYGEEMPASVMAEKLSVSVSGVHYQLRKLGLKPNGARRNARSNGGVTHAAAGDAQRAEWKAKRLAKAGKPQPNGSPSELDA
jgi:hypothetical protein